MTGYRAIRSDNMGWNRMPSRRFDQFEHSVFVGEISYQSPQNVCLDDRDGDRFERRLDIANVPVPRLETILCDRGYIERVSRSDYTHEENPFLIRSVVFTWVEARG